MEERKDRKIEKVSKNGNWSKMKKIRKIMDERKRGEERFDNREKTRGMEKMSKKR